MTKQSTSRATQLREDTVATLSIANDMVLAMCGHFEETVSAQRLEIERLTSRIHELEEQHAVKSAMDLDDSASIHGSDTAIPGETRIMNADSPLLGSVLE